MNVFAYSLRSPSLFSLQDDDGGGTLNIRELLGAIRDKKTGQAIVKACSKLRPLLDEDIW